MDADNEGRIVELAYFEERIKRLLMTKPFRRFEVVLSDGARYPVLGCCSLAVGRVTMSVVSPPQGRSCSFRKDQIVGIKVLAPAA